jgi:DNA-binding response OmpR family regulator
MKKGCGETILFAEDDGILRKMIKETLTMVGYEVLDAEDGDDALRKFNEHRDRIQLIILDVMMPKRNGKEVYCELKKANPHIKTIFISGYPANLLDTKQMLERKYTFISKPFIIDEFLVKVREVLDEPTYTS